MLSIEFTCIFKEFGAILGIKKAERNGSVHRTRRNRSNKNLWSSK